MITSEAQLVQLALALGASRLGGRLTVAERNLVAEVTELTPLDEATVIAARDAIQRGEDPLGDAFAVSRDAVTRRSNGAVYTPTALVEPMVTWVLEQEPTRVVDAGCGSGRFLAAVHREHPEIQLVAVDLDPLATLMTRATLAALGANKLTVLQADYTSLQLPEIKGKTAYLGNPPYVRHHQLSAETKAWAQVAAAALGYKISGLSGLHALFFLATAHLARPGDVGCFVTSAEWLDVNYGAIIRSLFLGELGGESLHVVEPKAMPFARTATTAVITSFRVGTQPETLRLQDIDSLTALKDLASAGRSVARARLQEATRWSGLLRTSADLPEGFVELGELCRVHRGTVTGANSVWVLAHAAALPEAVLHPSVTKARELFAAGDVLSSAAHLRLVVDIPSELDLFDHGDRKKVERFIKAAKRAGADKGYIASHRRAWWSVGLREPAPILATYMARRPPAFVLNGADARHINIAHGLYPREELDAHALNRLALALRTGVALSQGRVYAGGLTKFEPREMERLRVPDLATLRGHGPLSTDMVV